MSVTKARKSCKTDMRLTKGSHATRIGSLDRIERKKIMVMLPSALFFFSLGINVYKVSNCDLLSLLSFKYFISFKNNFHSMKGICRDTCK